MLSVSEGELFTLCMACPKMPSCFWSCTVSITRAIWYRAALQENETTLQLSFLSHHLYLWRHGLACKGKCLRKSSEGMIKMCIGNQNFHLVGCQYLVFWFAKHWTGQHDLADV